MQYYSISNIYLDLRNEPFHNVDVWNLTVQGSLNQSGWDIIEEIEFCKTANIMPIYYLNMSLKHIHLYMTHGCNEPSEKLIQVYFCISIFTWNISKFLKLRCYSNFLLIINWAQSIIGSESQCSKGDSCSNFFLDSNLHQFKGQSVLEY